MSIPVGLVDFLLSRIADHEGELNYLRNVGVQGPQYGSINSSLQHVIDTADADCRAKRAIVRAHDGATLYDLPRDPEFPPTHPCDGTHGVVECETLRALATTWSDRADFNPEWALNA